MPSRPLGAQAAGRVRRARGICLERRARTRQPGSEPLPLNVLPAPVTAIHDSGNSIHLQRAARASHKLNDSTLLYIGVGAWQCHCAT